MTRTVVKVKAAARLHLGLFDLGRGTPRTFGGVGFMIEQPATLVRARRSSVTEIDAIGLRNDTVDHLTAIVHRLLQEHKVGPAKINIEFRGVEHVGLGSKTALSLAVLTAASAARSISVSKRQLQRHCGRGGASGIGINGFFTGGFLADAGHKGQLPPPTIGKTDAIEPSNGHSSTGSSAQVARIHVPASRFTNIRRR